LRFLTGPLKGSTINLISGQNIIGKGSDCDIYVPDARVSKQHCILDVEEERCTIKDMNSTNKTMLGSLEEPMALSPGVSYPLKHGDTIVVGPDVVCVFLCPLLSKGTASVTTIEQSLNSTYQSDAVPSRTSTALMTADDLRETVEGLMNGMQNLYSLLGSSVAANGISASSEIGGTSAASAASSSYEVNTYTAKDTATLR
jgi:pSer/pThr/pTyr-binding forkhead associated (FHA) protein